MDSQKESIENYIKGNLSPGQREDFERRLSNDPSLLKELEAYRELLRGLDIGFNRELKSVLQKGVQNKGIKQRRSTFLYPLLGIAATLSLLVIAFFWLQSQKPDPSTLFISYYEKYPNVEMPISRSSAEASNPYAFYEGGDYEKASLFFDSLSKEEPTNPALFFYGALSSIELGNDSTALAGLKAVQDIGESKYLQVSLWYEALLRLRMGEKESAKLVLKELLREESKYKGRARDLLDEL